MGVTIHFEGNLRNKGALDELRTVATRFALEHQWKVEEIPNEVVTLARVGKDEEPWDYTGPVAGVLSIPNEDCDPIRLEFDENLYIQEFTKTQFAGVKTHVDVVALLRAVEPFFDSLTVDDEGEYWQNEDLTLLQRHLDAFHSALKDELKKHPNADVKVKLPDGRMVDFMT